MKRTLAVILSVLMAFTAFPFAVFAEEECNHENFNWVYHGENTEYDCTKDVVYRHKVCSDCGNQISDDSTIITQQGHTFLLDREKSVAATCSDSGINAYKCLYCTVTTQETVAPLVHKWGEYQVGRLCFEDGSDTQGEYIRYCELCGTSDTKKIVDHSYFVYEGKATSCYSAGLTDSRYCTVCGTYSVSVEIPKLEHVDKNSDTKCDYCDSPTVDSGAFCGCLCHSENSFVQFILPLLTFIWKLMGIDSCECGKMHY